MSSSQILTATSLLGLSSSFWVSGIHFSASQLTVPILYRFPDTISTDFFKDFYYRGLAVVVPLALFSSVNTAIAAYLDPSKSLNYAIAAACTVSALPWTLIMMKGVNERLIKLSEDAKEREKADKGEVVELLKKWHWMNMVRAMCGLAGGIVALATYAGLV